MRLRPGSVLGIDMISRDYLDNPAATPFLDLLAIRWQFGTSDPAGFLVAHGSRAHVRGFDEVGRSFGRWPTPGVSDDVADRAARRAGR